MMPLEQYRHVQSVAKQVHAELARFIDSASTEQSIALQCKQLLADLGIIDSWYHGVPAFVLLGSRSCLSQSGRDYVPHTEAVGEFNLVTVDLSPLLAGVWGDCARSYCVEAGRVTPAPFYRGFVEGLAAQKELHRLMREFVTPDKTFQSLYHFGNEQIQALGYENLDFLRNLGHSIETNPDQRRYIDANCYTTFGEVAYFTFEPHIRQVGDIWGFKHENIYYFDSSGVLQEL